MAELNLNELNEQIKLINKELGNIDSKKFGQGQIKEAKAELSRLRGELNRVNSDVDYFNQSLKSSIQELSRTNVALSVSKKSFKSLVGIAEDFSQVLSGQVTLSQKDIDKKKSLARLEFQRLKAAKDSGDLDEQATSEITARLEEEQKFINALEDVENFQKRINKAASVRTFEGLQDIAQAIPGLRKFSGVFEDTAKTVRDIVRERETEKRISDDLFKLSVKRRKKDLESLKTGDGLNKATIKRLGLEGKLLTKKGKNLTGTAAAKKAKKLGISSKDLTPVTKTAPKSINAMLKGITTLGKSLLKSLGPITIIATIIKTIVELFVNSEKRTLEIAKNLTISKASANVIRLRFAEIAKDSKNILVNTESLAAAQNDLTKDLGAAVNFSDKTLENQVFLTKNLNLSGESAAKFNNLIDSTGKSAFDVTTNVIGINKQFAKSTGILIPTRSLIDSVASTSLEIAGYFGMNVENLAKGVIQVRKFGLNLENANSLAKSLLDFETSIGSELEAELLTGKEFNFERARSMAVMGDIAGATSEVLTQMQNLTEEQRRSPIIMESVAKSTGLSVEQINKAFNVQRRLNMQTAEYNKFLARGGKIGMENAVQQMALEGASREQINATLSAQEAFNAAITKAKDQLTRLDKSGAITKFTDFLIGFTSGLAQGKGIFAAFRAGSKAVKESSSEIKPNKLNTTGDVSLNDFTIRSNPKDTLVMAGGTRFGEETNKLLRELISAVKEGGDVVMDGNKVGQAINLAAYRTTTA